MYGYELTMARKRQRDTYKLDMLLRPDVLHAYDDAAALEMYKAGASYATVRYSVNVLIAYALWKLGMKAEVVAATYDVNPEQLVKLTLDHFRYSETERAKIEEQIAIAVPETPHAVGDQVQPAPLYEGIGRSGATYGASIH